jgi:signal peptidase II
MQLARQKRWLWGPLSPLGASFAIATLALDQASKWWMLAVYRLQDGHKMTVTPFFNLVYVKNLGISYGLLPLDSDVGQRLLAAFAGLAVLAMAAWLAHGVTGKLMAASIGLIMGGAAGKEGPPATPSTACCWAGWPISSSCMPSGSTGTSSISPTRR